MKFICVPILFNVHCINTFRNRLSVQYKHTFTLSLQPFLTFHSIYVIQERNFILFKNHHTRPALCIFSVFKINIGEIIADKGAEEK